MYATITARNSRRYVKRIISGLAVFTLRMRQGVVEVPIGDFAQLQPQFAGGIMSISDGSKSGQSGHTAKVSMLSYLDAGRLSRRVVLAWLGASALVAASDPIHGLLSRAASRIGITTGGGTIYPILDPRFAYAAARHRGDTRVGTQGDVMTYKGTATVVPDFETAGPCVLQFQYAFSEEADPEEVVGVFFSFGQSGITTTNPDCTEGPALDLHHDSTFNLTNLMRNAHDRGISIERLLFVLCPDGQDQTLTLRVELEDRHGQKMFTRVSFDSWGSEPVTVDLPLSSFQGAIELTAVKQIALMLEEHHVADGVTNPPQGGFRIAFVGLVDGDGPPLGADAVARLCNRRLVEELARRDFESLLRLVDTKTGASLDRTLFRDLIQWGATGWLLAALPLAAQRGWIGGDEARARALQILRFVDHDSLWGDEPVGKVGNSRGIMYHFGGIDPTGLDGPLTGTRKPDPGNCNAVEASVIDTAIFQYGAATCAAGFSSPDPRDQEIREHVRRILNRTRWPELIDPLTGQLFLAWKPEREVDDTHHRYFTAPAAFGGFWASHNAQGTKPITIDYWTDEGAMAAILAVGSEVYATSPVVWYRMHRILHQGATADVQVVVTFPGAWFTYTFLTATYLDPRLGPDRGAEYGTTAVNWTANAIAVFNAYRALSPQGQLILPDAAELPDTTYLAQGLPQLAVDANARFTGTRTLYSLQLAVGLGGWTTWLALGELRRLLRTQPDLWDPLFGCLDSFHPNLAEFVPAGPEPQPLERMEGRWVQQQVWPLNKGAALLAQLNYLTGGLVWQTANRHPVVQRGIDRIYRQPKPQQGHS